MSPRIRWPRARRRRWPRAPPDVMLRHSPPTPERACALGAREPIRIEDAVFLVTAGLVQMIAAAEIPEIGKGL